MTSDERRVMSKTRNKLTPTHHSLLVTRYSLLKITIPLPFQVIQRYKHLPQLVLADDTAGEQAETVSDGTIDQHINYDTPRK